MEPSHSGAVETRLVDRLCGADVTQFGRPVRGADDHRYGGQVRFDDGGVEVRGRCARGAQCDSRRSADQRRPEGRKPRTTFVEKHLDFDARFVGEGERHRSRTRPGCQKRVLDPESHPFVDQRRAERRLCVGRGVGVYRVSHEGRDLV